MTDDDLLLHRLRLAATPGVGARTARLLEDRLGPPDVIFGLDEPALIAQGVPRRIAAALVAPGPARRAAELRDRLAAAGVRAIPLGAPEYPPALASIVDPPQVLTARGEAGLLDQPAVAIVGARRGDPIGLDLTAELASDLAAAGLVVVSGLARGIDAAAHAGALAAGGVTWAVLPGGVDRVYPRRNRGLAARIVDGGGALLSELPPDQEPQRHDFPRRNRIVTGLAEGVIVVQAGPRSGALISADFALQQGRELFAVPGSPRDPLAQGPNRLLRDGASLVTCAQDVLDALRGVEQVAPPTPGSPEALLLDALDARTARDLDALAEQSGLGLDAVMVGLGRLELEGHVEATPAGFRRVART